MTKRRRFFGDLTFPLETEHHNLPACFTSRGFSVILAPGIVCDGVLRGVLFFGCPLRQFRKPISGVGWRLAGGTHGLVSGRALQVWSCRCEPVVKPLLHSTGDASRLDCVARRSHIGNMLPPRALPDGRLPRLDATRGFTTGS